VSGWKKVELGKVADFINGDRGQNYPSEGDFIDSGIPFVNAGHLADGKVDFSKMNYISESRFELLGSGKIQANDILYCLRGSLGKAAIYREDRPAAIASSLVIIRPSGECSVEYLYHFLAGSLGQREMRKFDNGSSQPNLSATSVKNYVVPLPTLNEQRRIAAILDKADALRQKRRLSLQKLDSLTQSIFLDMFGDPLNGRQSELVALEDVCERITDGTHQPPGWSESGIPFLFVSNVRGRAINFETQKFISDSTYAELTRTRPIDVGDVLYTTVGSYGNAAVVRDDRKFAFQRHIAHLKPKRNRLEPEFLAVMLETQLVRRQADQAARGIAQKTLNLEQIRAFRILVPELEVQKSFVARLLRVCSAREQMDDSDQALNLIFTSLQHRAFRGEL